MTNPKACTCHTHPPAKPQAVELAKMEAILADCRARKATAKVGTPMPMIACLADKAADLRKGNARQASAEIDRLKAENMTLKAKIAATSKPAPAKPATLTAAAYLASVAKPEMSRAEFSALPHGERGKAIKTISLVS
jgi:hypothetical protein